MFEIIADEIENYLISDQIFFNPAAPNPMNKYNDELYQKYMKCTAPIKKFFKSTFGINLPFYME